MIFRKFERRVLTNFDWYLFISVLLLCAAGLGVLYSAGYNSELASSPPMEKQAASMALGLIGFFIGLVLHNNFWRRGAWVFYVIGCLLLVAILATGVVAGGARRWLDLGGFRMQPSEFMKLGIIFVLARLFSGEHAPREGYTFLKLIVPGLIVGLPMVLTVMQPDLGTGLVQFLVGGTMVLIFGVQGKTLLRIGLAGAIFSYPSWHMLKDYQRNRILNFLSPEMDPLGSGYHAIQSKIAVGSGALAGKGFLQGTQTQLRFLPEQTTDFIFSVLAEEWGFIGSVGVLLIYAFLIFRLVRVAARSQDKFSSFVAVGVASLIFWQVLMNIGMVIGVLPVVGITLPLLSFGGSSVVTVMSAVGIVAGISVRRFLFASK